MNLWDYNLASNHFDMFCIENKVLRHDRVIPYFSIPMINYLINDIAASSAIIVTSGWNLKIDPGTSGVTGP